MTTAGLNSKFLAGIVFFFGLLMKPIAVLYAQEVTPLLEPLIADPPFPPVWINYIIGDHKGFLWIATGAGLYKYDGYSLINFTHEPGDPQSLHSSGVKFLLPDDKERLWIGTWEGLNLLDLKTNRLTRLHVTGKIMAICQDNKHNVWVGTHGDGIYVLDQNASVISHLRGPGALAAGLPSDSTGGLFKDRSGTLWIGTAQGLGRWDDVRNIFHIVNLRTSWKEPPSVARFFQDWRGDIWVCTRGQGVIHLNERGELIHWYELGGGWIGSAAEDVYGNVWMGFIDGLYRFDPRTKTFSKYIHPNFQRPKNFNVQCLYQGEAGILWIGTDRGLGKFNTMKTQLSYFHPSITEPGVEADTHICAIQEDRYGFLWLGLEGLGTRKSLVRLKREQHGSVASFSTTLFSVKSNVWSIVAGDHDILWLGTFGVA